MEVLGVDIFAGTFARASRRWSTEPVGQGGYVVHCNVHVLMTAQDDADFMEALGEAWLVMPDGAPVAWLQRRLGEPTAERVAGPDLMQSVMDRGRAYGLRHVLFGSPTPCGRWSRGSTLGFRA